MESYSNYQYSLELLHKLNIWIKSNPSLLNHFEYQGYNFWQAYQQSIFGDILTWSRTQKLDHVQHRASVVQLFRIGILCLCMAFISGFSLLYLLLRRHKVIVFTGDKVSERLACDARIHPLYEALYETKIPFVEIVHTILGKNTILSFFRRKRPVIYLEVIDPMLFFYVRIQKMFFSRLLKNIDLAVFDQKERYMVKTIIAKYASSVVLSKGRVLFFEKILHYSNVKKIFSIDDVRHYNEIVLSSRLSNVDFYAIQHGHFTKYHVGWLRNDLLGNVIKPHYLIVWSDYWKQELIRLGSYFHSDEILVGGTKGYSSFVHTKKEDAITRIVIPYETEAPKKEVRAYIERLSRIPNVSIVIKTRSDQDEALQAREYGIDKDNPIVRAMNTIDSILGTVSVVIGTYSTYLYDMVQIGKPILLMKTSIDYGEGMVQNGFAEFLSLDESMESVLARATETDEKILLSRRETLIGRNPQLLKNTIIHLLSGL